MTKSISPCSEANGDYIRTDNVSCCRSKMFPHLSSRLRDCSAQSELMVGRNDGVTNGLRFFVKIIDSLDRRDCDAIHGRGVLAPVPRPIQEEQQRNGKYGQ